MVTADTLEAAILSAVPEAKATAEVSPEDFPVIPVRTVEVIPVTPAVTAEATPEPATPVTVAPVVTVTTKKCNYLALSHHIHCHAPVRFGGSGLFMLTGFT